MRGWIPIVIATAMTVPGLALELGLFHAASPVQALLFGVAIVGCAFLLSWAAEVIQLEISQGLALALLALIAILPEYIVDATFAWLAASDPSYRAYAVANMTGANRLLIGVAWPLVVLLVWIRTRKRTVTLESGQGLSLIVLLAATIYAFIIPFKGSISIIDLIVLGALFAFYVWRLAKLPAEEPHLVGPSLWIGGLAPGLRRLVTGALAILASGVILLVAEPFAMALVYTGGALGIDRFLLVQWIAPLASEAPEFVVVGIFAWRGAAGTALGALVSSKINQWTLLIAMLPLIYAIALGRMEGLPLDGHQQQEILLTAAQSLFAILLLLDFRLSLVGAGALFGLFIAQFVMPDIRMPMIGVYLLAGLITVVVSRDHLGKAFQDLRASRSLGGEP
jgi:cation:H+ antiporter